MRELGSLVSTSSSYMYTHLHYVLQQTKFETMVEVVWKSAAINLGYIISTGSTLAAQMGAYTRGCLFSQVLINAC